MKTIKMQKLSNLILIMASLALVACDDVHPDDHQSPSEAKIINMVREFQRVKRYDCKDNLISDKVTTVKSPTKTITIRPKSYKNLFSSNFKNETNGAGSGSVWGYDTITLDMANAWLTMQVVSGINEIAYQFKNCDHSIEQGEVCNSFQVEEGSMFINVNYSEVLLEGFREYRPSEEECNQNENP
jgi:hypothetical protein